MQIVFIRHGETTYDFVTEKGYIGHGRSLSQLTETGKQQALKAAEDERLDGIEIIVSSPYTRALETAAIISSRRNVDINIELDLQEWMPDLSFQFSSAEVSVQAARLCTLNKGKCPDDSPVRYEELQAVFNRANMCLKKYLNYNKIAVVTHGIVIRQFAFAEKIPYCGISQVEFNQNFKWKGFIEKMEIDFRPICEADFPQLCKWRNSEHVIKWYGKTPVTVDEVAEHHMPYITGEKPTKAYFIVMGGTDIGYIQTYRIADYPDYNAYVKADPTSAGVDLFIGHTDYVHKGYGMHVMKAFLEKYVFIGDIDKCIIGPEPDNKSAIRMYEKSGFEWYKTIQLPDEDAPEHLMMITKEKFILEKISQTS